MGGGRRRLRLISVLAAVAALAAPLAAPVTAASPPSNDEIDAALSITVPSVTTLDTTGATASPTDPPCFAGPRLGATVWFTFTTGPDDFGTYYLDTFGSDYDTTVAFYTPGAQDEVFCYYDSRGTKQTYLEAAISPDTTYYVLVGSASESTLGGNLVLTITDQAPPPPVPPPHDDIAGATEITSLPFRDAVDASLATWSETDPVIYGDFICSTWSTWANSVWYTYTPAEDVYVQLDTFGSEFNEALTVFTGTPDALTQIAGCDVDGGTPDEYAPWVEFQASAGTTYYILVTAYPTQPAGFLVLNARESVPFTIDVTVHRTWDVNTLHGYVIGRVTVTCSRFGYLALSGTLTQTTRTRTAISHFFEPVTCSDTMPREFVVSPDPESTDGFGAGKATLHLEVTGDSHGYTDVEVIDTTIQLRARR